MSFGEAEVTRLPIRIAAIGAAAALAACGSYTGEPKLEVNGEGQAVECRSTPVPGSNMQQRVCATPAEWEQIDRSRRAATQDAVRRLEQRSAIAAPSSGD